MIRVDRTRVREPSSLRAEKVWRRIFNDAFYYSEPLASRRQERHEFDRGIVYGENVVRSLFELFSNRCAYCESMVTGASFVIDHFRPIRGTVHSPKRYSEDHYWWLAYDWQNLNLSCAACHEAKGPKFPIEGEPVEIFADWEQLATEKRYLLNPCLDDPAGHLFYTRFGEIGGSTPSGKTTVAVLELNRPGLVAARQAHLSEIRPMLDEFGQRARKWRGLSGVAGGRLKSELALIRSRPVQRLFEEARAIARISAFPGMTLHFLREETYTGLGVHRSVLGRWWSRPDGAAALADASLASRKTSARQRRKLATPKIESVSLRNFRGIEELELRCARGAGPTAPWLMLLGENAAGKTSILQAIAIALMGEKRRGSLRLTPAKLLRQGASSGSIAVKLSGQDEPVRLDFSMHGGIRSSHKDPGVLLLGYGAARLMERSPPSSPLSNAGTVRIRNLFDHFSPLIDADRWLMRLRPKAFDYTARALKDILFLDPNERLERRPGVRRLGIRVRLRGSRVALDDLSDGYQSVLGLTADIISGLNAERVGGLEAAEGIVLLDEIGAHLHPRWRMRVVSRLRRAFPRLQFISSTHDPLCLRGLEDGEVAVLRRNRSHRVYAVDELPPVKGMTSEQLLTSEYFGLFSTVDPEIEEAFTRYYELLSQQRLSRTERQEVERLRTQLVPLRLLGKSRRERVLLNIIDKFLALQPEDPTGVAERKLAGIVRGELRALLPSRGVSQ